jgi:hypothetical protein
VLRPERAARDVESAVLVDNPRDLPHGGDFAIVATFDNRIELVVEVVCRRPLPPRQTRDRVTGLF